MPIDERCIVAPSDARALIGAFGDGPLLPIKEKFFDVAELLGENKPAWQQRFQAVSGRSSG